MVNGGLRTLCHPVNSCLRDEGGPLNQLALAACGAAKYLDFNFAESRRVARYLARGKSASVLAFLFGRWQLRDNRNSRFGLPLRRLETVTENAQEMTWAWGSPRGDFRGACRERPLQEGQRETAARSSYLLPYHVSRLPVLARVGGDANAQFGAFGSIASMSNRPLGSASAPAPAASGSRAIRARRSAKCALVSLSVARALRPPQLRVQHHQLRPRQRPRIRRPRFRHEPRRERPAATSARAAC